MDDDEYGAIGGMISKGNGLLDGKPAPVPLCPPEKHYFSRLSAELRHGLDMLSVRVKVLFGQRFYFVLKEKSLQII
jgi:hypothetical protein